MPPNAFSAALTKLRERRTLSGREFSKLADVDHAYESRLESGDKENPSDETIDKLLRGLKLKSTDRDAQILRYLAQHPETRTDFVIYVLDQEQEAVSFDVFTMVAGTKHRGTPPAPDVLVGMAQKYLKQLSASSDQP